MVHTHKTGRCYGVSDSALVVNTEAVVAAAIWCLPVYDVGVKLRQSSQPQSWPAEAEPSL